MAKRFPTSREGETMVGRILSLNRLKGHGIIRTMEDEDIFLSSYYVPRNAWSKISVGDYVQFVVSCRKANRTVAKDVTIVKKMPRRLSIVLPNQETLEVRHIYKYGKSSLLEEGYGEIYPNYPPESFDYVYIETARKNWVFNQINSPIIIDGETDIDAFYNYLTDLLLY